MAPNDPARDDAPTWARVVVALLLGAAGTVLTGAFWNWTYAPLVGWDAVAVTFVGWVWLKIRAMDAGGTRTHATREDPGRRLSEAILLTASVASLVAVGVILVAGGSSSRAWEAGLAGLGVASVALSWTAVHTLFTLRYARLYYGGAGGGIGFNQQDDPRYSDFAYLGFTIGMTYQVSDTDLQTTTVRATALQQALLSYLFGSVILATTINLVASLGSRG